MPFELEAPFAPSGDQPQAIDGLVSALEKGEKHMTLLGVTGSGKTFSMANVIQRVQRPTLIISHNKTLAAQLASEFREFFPKNAVQYFVSYYDYYQPEAYIPSTATYIEKETQLNEEIDRLRYAAIQSLLSRRDVIIVASVSCIYGLGSPEAYQQGSLHMVARNASATREKLIIKLVEMNFARNDIDFARGTFRVRGSIVEVYPKAADRTAYRFDFFGDELEKIEEIDVLTGDILNTFTEVTIYPATMYQTQQAHFEKALQQIRADLPGELEVLRSKGRDLEAQRLEQRVNYDLEMIENTGFVNGVENYSRYFDGRAAGTPPYTLIDFFPKDFLLIIDESHQSVPQIGAMYAGDRSRKTVLTDYGFRMQSAFDNRPLKFDEFEKKMTQTVYVSATPGPYEKAHAQVVVEQLIRPTGIIEPKIFVRPTQGQIPNLLEEVKMRIEKQQRVLVTTLTKRMAEELADFLNEKGIKVQYLHSDVDTMERLEILRDLRIGKYDVLVGINLLREGLDLPEVSLVAILDADKEGFLRSETSLVQTMGRAARHIEGTVIMYADVITGSMQRAMKEVERRRVIQENYNTEHGLTPQKIESRIREDRLSGQKVAEQEVNVALEAAKGLQKNDLDHLIADLQQQMKSASEKLEFERAASLRDQIGLLMEASADPLRGGKKRRSKKK